MPSWRRARTFVSGIARRQEAAFSLIELIGVMAVLAILATILFTATIRHLDRVASDQEYVQLKSISQAFQASVVRHRYIPGAAGTSNWVEMVAQELGADNGLVSTNARRMARTFLVDPALQVGTNGFGLPYRQTIAGSVVTNALGAVILPTNPRLLVLSSMGPALPGSITNGGLSTNDFNAIWDATDGSRPPGSVWDAWKGTGEDLKVQRLNLSSLFAHLLLENAYTNSSTNLGRYAIDGSATNQVPAKTVDAYFLTGSLLNLVSQDGVSDCKQIISRDAHFVYSLGIWRGSLYDSPTLSTPLFDLMIRQFLASPSNPHADNVDMRYNYGTNPPAMVATKAMLVDHYKQYMQLYIAWAQAGFPMGGAYDPLYKNPLNQMKDDIKDIADHLDKDVAEGECIY